MPVVTIYDWTYTVLIQIPINYNNTTLTYEDNSPCISQIQRGHIKGDKTKHISPKIFYTRDLQKKGVIEIQKIQSNENQANLFIKSLP